MESRSTENMNTESLPPLRFAARSDTGLHLYRGPDGESKSVDSLTNVSGSENFCRVIKYNDNGEIFAWADEANVHISDSSSGKELLVIPAPKTQALHFSPVGSFLLLWKKYTPEDPENMKIFSSKSGELVTSFVQRTFAQVAWPYIQWTSDEILAARMMNNEILFYDGMHIEKGPVRKFSVSGIRSFSVAPGPAPYKVATFIPEKKGAPGKVQLYIYPSFEAPEAHKSFFRAQNVDFCWNSLGTALLMWTHADVDVSGKSYYGETRLYFLRSDGKVDTQVPLEKEGQIHSVQWNPNGREFAVCHGYTPAKTMLFDQYCKPLYDFGNAPRNTISWSPHGRFLVIAGFGGMSGEIDFWDRNRFKLMGTSKVTSAAGYSWSPDSRWFLTAILSPRLRVDNGYTIFTYSGIQIANEFFNELYEVVWQPCLSYPDRPASPTVKAVKEADVHVKAEAKPAPYRPPSLRNKPNYKPSTSVLRQADGPKRIVQAGAASQVVPGASPVHMQISASAKRRERRKAKSKAEAQSLAVKAELESLSAPKGEEDTKKTLTKDEAEKKTRAITKKLRQIDGLKEKDFDSLTNEQKAKIGMEQEMRDELESLSKIISARYK